MLIIYYRFEAAPPMKEILGRRNLAAAEPIGPPTAPDNPPAAVAAPKPPQLKLPEVAALPK